MESLLFVDISRNKLSQLPSNGSIEELILSDNNFQKIPPVGYMYPKLMQLDLKNNQVTKLELNQPACFLKKIDISDNPIEELYFDRKEFPILQEITFGSSSTLYINDLVLELIRDKQVAVELSNARKENLLLPNRSVIEQGSESLQQYLTSDTPPISAIFDYSRKWMALEWLLNRNERAIQCFSCEKDFAPYVNFSFLFHNHCFASVVEIDLTDCNFAELPDWNFLENLKRAYLRGNNLQTVPGSHSLEYVDISGNKMNELSLGKNDFPLLSHVIAGSKELQFIRFDTICRLKDDLQKLKIDDIFQEYLIFPPKCVLNEISRLDEFLQNPEVYLLEVELSKRKQALNWLIEDADFKFDEFNLAEQFELFEFYTGNEFNNVFNSPNLRYINCLNLKNCRLASLPNLKCLESLDILDVSSNKLEDMSALENDNLKDLDVSVNPIVEVHIDFEKCPKIEKITIGSNKTERLSVPVMQRACWDQLDIVPVNEEYVNYLCKVAKAILGDRLKKNFVSQFLNSGGFDISWFNSKIPYKFSRYVDILGQILLTDIKINTKIEMD